VPRLIWTAEALIDVERLHGWLKAKDADAARRASVVPWKIWTLNIGKS